MLALTLSISYPDIQPYDVQSCSVTVQATSFTQHAIVVRVEVALGAVHGNRASTTSQTLILMTKFQLVHRVQPSSVRP